MDYLIFKRALVLSGGSSSQVAGGLKSPNYQEALSEWTLSGRDESAAKFFNPFGSAFATTAGYRSAKYASNGPDNTWSGWQSSLDPTPVVHVKGTSGPKEFVLAAIPGAQFERHFLRGESTDGMPRRPRLVDVAIWWLRSRDLESLGIDADSDPQALIEVLVSEVGLTVTEVDALFDAKDLTLDVT